MKRLFIIMAAGVMLTGCNGNSSSSDVPNNNSASKETAQESIISSESSAAYFFNEDTGEYEVDPAESMYTTAGTESVGGEDKADNTTPSAETTEENSSLIAPPEGEQIDPFE